MFYLYFNLIFIIKYKLGNKVNPAQIFPHPINDPQIISSVILNGEAELKEKQIKEKEIEDN